jgi:uncharacterized protein YqeY
MTIQEQINSDLKTAMKEQNEKVKSLLRVVIGELNRKGKVVGDDQVIATIKKMIEGAKETGNLDEVPILENYLPQQLGEAELSALISALIYSNNYTAKDMGKIMATLKEKHSGKYDGKLASTIAKELLSKQVV